MNEHIQAKLKELKENFPENPEFRSWMQQSNQWCWVYSILKIRGEKVHKTSVVNMVQGSINENLTLSAYVLADHFRTVYQDMIGFIGMDTELEPRMVFRWAKMILDLDPSEPDESVFRKNRSAVYEWDLIPEAEDRVPELFEGLLREYKLSGFDGKDPLKRAVRLHMEMNRLYPFGEDTTFISMTVLMFSLLELGYPLPQLSLDDREYNELMADYVENGDIAPFKAVLEKSIYNRLDAAVSLARQAKESE